MKQMSMIIDMKEAWNTRSQVSHEQYELYFKDMVSNMYHCVENAYIEYCKKTSTEYKSQVFYSFQELFAVIILADNQILQGEYDAYLKYCSFAGFKPLDSKELKKLIAQIDDNRILTHIHLIDSLRDHISDDDYSTFIRSLCYLSLMGDKVFDEREYSLIRNFYREGYDEVPNSFEELKKEWI